MRSSSTVDRSYGKVRAPRFARTARRSKRISASLGGQPPRRDSQVGTHRIRTMKRTKPPFRADMVGSLLRTQPLKEARVKHQAGAMSAEELKAVEDAEIRAIIRKQE